jgi:hypothetical protein
MRSLHRIAKHPAFCEIRPTGHNPLFGQTKIKGWALAQPLCYVFDRLTFKSNSSKLKVATLTIYDNNRRQDLRRKGPFPELPIAIGAPGVYRSAAT